MAAPSTKPSILFVCVANSCRSQMAEAIARSLAGGRWEVWSAGSQPSGRVHPVAEQLMAEAGLLLQGHRSKGLDEVPGRPWDYVVTMGCGDRCPTVSARQRIAWDIPDPVGLPVEDARRIRDQITGLIQQLIHSQEAS